MKDPYGLVASGLPPELAAEIEGVNTRKAIAQAMLKQSMADIQPMETKGRFASRISPFQGLAQMFQAYTGQKGISDAEKSTADIGQKYQTGQREAMSKYEGMRQGTPEMPVPENVQALNQGLAQADPSIPVSSIIPAKQGDPKAAVAEAMVNPYLRGNAKVLADLKAIQPNPKLGSWFDQTTGRKQTGVVDLADPTKLTPIGGPQSADSQMGGALPYQILERTVVDGKPMMTIFNRQNKKIETIPYIVSAKDDPNVRGAVKEGEAAGKERGEQKTKAQAELDTIQSDLTRYRTHASELLGDPTKGIPRHPGFENLVGFTWKPGARYIEGSKEADAQSRVDQIVAHAEKAAYVFLKGGGHITEQERQTIAKSLSRVKKATSEKEFVSAIKDHDNLLETVLTNKRRIASGEAFRNPNFGADKTKPASVYVETRATKDGRKLGRKADGTIEEIK